MGEMERLMNLKCTKAARGSIAPFLGYANVAPEEAAGPLTSGLWLVRGEGLL
jgi:hypothetical protein